MLLLWLLTVSLVLPQLSQGKRENSSANESVPSDLRTFLRWAPIHNITEEEDPIHLCPPFAEGLVTLVVMAIPYTWTATAAHTPLTLLNQWQGSQRCFLEGGNLWSATYHHPASVALNLKWGNFFQMWLSTESPSLPHLASAKASIDCCLLVAWKLRHRPPFGSWCTQILLKCRLTWILSQTLAAPSLVPTKRSNETVLTLLGT